MDKFKLIERATKLLASRQVALRDTLEEIKFLDECIAENPKGEYLSAREQATTKRDRQQKAVEASQGLIAALQANQTPRKPK